MSHDETSATESGPSVPEELDVAVHSSALEHVIEHIFLSEVLQEAWFGRRQVVDVLHTSVDAFGYDVVLELEGITRHVQLKARGKQGKASSYKINTSLARHASGCVVSIGWERDHASNRMSLEYRWFGGAPGASLPDLGDVVGRHSKGDATGTKKERAQTRVLRLTRFSKVADVGELLDLLFGPVSH